VITLNGFICTFNNLRIPLRMLTRVQQIYFFLLHFLQRSWYQLKIVFSKIFFFILTVPQFIKVRKNCFNYTKLSTILVFVSTFMLTSWSYSQNWFPFDPWQGYRMTSDPAKSRQASSRRISPVFENIQYWKQKCIRRNHR
jgi:hypothetical protein